MPTFSFSPEAEYSIQDLTATAVRRDGARFPFSQGTGELRKGLLEDAMYDKQPKAGVMKGSGRNPRAHLRVVNDPKCELTMPIDTATRFANFCGQDGTVIMLFTRRTPVGPAVTDRVYSWKPLFSGPTFKAGDPVSRKISGTALRIDEDVKNVLA